MGDLWKYLAIGAISLCGGMYEGQMEPNRNVVTQDQIAKFDDHMASIDESLRDIREKFNYLKGEVEQQDRAARRQQQGAQPKP